MVADRPFQGPLADCGGEQRAVAEVRQKLLSEVEQKHFPRPCVTNVPSFETGIFTSVCILIQHQLSYIT